MMISGIKNKAGQKGPPASLEGQGHPLATGRIRDARISVTQVQNAGVSRKEGKL